MKRPKVMKWMLIIGMSASMLTGCANAQSNTPAGDSAGQTVQTVQESVSDTDPAAGSNGAQTQEGALSETDAKKIAFDDAGVSEAEITYIKIRRHQEDGRHIYEIDFTVGTKEYDYDIDALDGTIHTKEMKTEDGKKQGDNTAAVNQTKENGVGLITEAEAVAIAFKDAGVKESDVSNIRARLDWEDGVQVYEVEFYAGAKEYDYDINASDGTVSKKDMEIEDDFRPVAETAEAVGGRISEEDAKKAALDRVPGAGQDTIRLHQDTEDGKSVYEGKIIYGGREYEFEIDAATGEFRKWEEESAYDR